MPEQTLQKLLDGNRRFAENRPMLDESESRRRALASEQHPFAIVLGCVDSRVPPELIFDQGLGELLVIRTAGEVLDRAVLGSMEFGVTELKIPLIVVLGHENCGAIKTAWDVLHKRAQPETDIQYLVDHLALAIEIGTDEKGNELDRAARAQVVSVVLQLRAMPVMKRAINRGQLKIVGAWYDLDTGNAELVIE